MVVILLLEIGFIAMAACRCKGYGYDCIVCGHWACEKCDRYKCKTCFEDFCRKSLFVFNIDCGTIDDRKGNECANCEKKREEKNKKKEEPKELSYFDDPDAYDSTAIGETQRVSYDSDFEDYISRTGAYSPEAMREKYGDKREDEPDDKS